MKPKLLLLPLAVLLTAHAGAATILSDTFSTDIVGSVPGWTETGSNLFGQGVGVEGGNAFFQIDAASIAGIYKDTGIMGLLSETITIAFDFRGKNNAEVYTGVFTASLWDGVPGVGTQLGSNVPVNPAAGVTSPISFGTILGSNTASNLYVAFNAGVSGNGNFQQPLIDNVLVTSVPEPSAALLGGLGLLALLRRRR